MPKKDHIPKKIKDEVIARANSSCEYCKLLLAFSTAPFAMDHIIAESKGGQTTLANLALTCFNCNGSKYNFTEAIDPLTQETVPLFNPRNHTWKEHFKWSDDFLHVIGLTSTGRATIERLKMNRPATVNLRRVIRGYGHPPE